MSPFRVTVRGGRPASAVVALAVALAVGIPSVTAATLSAQATQPIDSAYTAKIREYLQDPRITTELVDHLPASSTVPTPLAFLGRIVGTPGELTYAKDIHRYFDALDAASPRVKVWRMGKTEEGRDMILAAIADSATIARLDDYKRMLGQLTDPRVTSPEEAKRLFGVAKPIYWITSGMHSPENGGPEMLMELGYRLAVQETPFIRTIRDSIITFITPVIEVDGREKQVDTYKFNKTRARGESRLPLMYWGKYVAHDNNRDQMGQFLALSRHITKTFLEWTPQVIHDLHEAATYLYSSTGTGPYNEAIDAITVGEWWTMAQVDVMELTKRGVPGVWTYGFYDGWVPNYMFFTAHAHNATGRFYEVQSYGPDNYEVRPGATTRSREWFRPNPPLEYIKWGPRNNTNIQQSAILFSLKHFADRKADYLENYWLKNRRSLEKGRSGAPYAWVIPAAQRRKADAADAVNELRRQGLEIHVASAPFRAGALDVKTGDWIVRADQPYRTLADMYFSVQAYAPENPRPYDDTGWTFQLMRNVAVLPVADSSVLTRPMTRLAEAARARGGLEGSGPVVLVDHTTDNNLVALRYRFAATPMRAAERAFEAAGRSFRAGAFIIEGADAAALGTALAELGLTGVAVAAAPDVPSHAMDLPRIGYVHAWQRTQDEGWVRAAFDTYGIPYTYFADTELKKGGLRERFDVIVYPHVGGTPQAHVAGVLATGSLPLPYRRTDSTPNLGVMDSAADIRGGMGMDGLAALRDFVAQGGTLITEGSTTTLFPAYNLSSGVEVESPSGLFARGSVMRGVVADRASPIAYGFDAQVPVYFNQAPVLRVGGTSPGFGSGRVAAAAGQNITPVAGSGNVPVSAWDFGYGSAGDSAAASTSAAGGRGGAGAARGRGGFGGFGGGGAPVQVGGALARYQPRVVLRFPENANDILLSGTLDGGEALSERAQVVDVPVGEGHVVMFAIRPFWRWQTQGTFFLGFNALLHWNDLDAGR